MLLPIFKIKLSIIGEFGVTAEGNSNSSKKNVNKIVNKKAAKLIN